MPGDTITSHPNLKNVITFIEKTHKYIDNFNKNYISVTTLISHAFEKFDSEKIAEKCAIKRGVKKEDLIKEWSEKGREAARVGTRLHENAEHYIKYSKLLHEPENITEKIKFNSEIKIIEGIKKKYSPISMEPEKLVFSPDFGIAGSIDLLVKIDELNYIIFDWKNLSKDIEKTSFNNKKGTILPTLNILDCNYWHYALQLQIYENILKSENYVPINSTFKKYLIVWNRTAFKIEEIPYVPEGWALMLWANKINNI